MAGQAGLESPGASMHQFTKPAEPLPSEPYQVASHAKYDVTYSTLSSPKYQEPRKEIFQRATVPHTMSRTGTTPASEVPTEAQILQAVEKGNEVEMAWTKVECIDREIRELLNAKQLDAVKVKRQDRKVYLKEWEAKSKACIALHRGNPELSRGVGKYLREHREKDLVTATAPVRRRRHSSTIEQQRWEMARKRQTQLLREAARKRATRRPVYPYGYSGYAPSAWSPPLRRHIKRMGAPYVYPTYRRPPAAAQVCPKCNGKKTQKKKSGRLGWRVVVGTLWNRKNWKKCSKCNGSGTLQWRRDSV